MNKDLIELFKVREFGDFISESIGFLIREFKLLALTILLFVGPFIIFYTFILRRFGIGLDMDVFEFLRYGGDIRDLATYRMPYILQFISLLQSIVTFTVIAIYIKLYSQRGSGNFTLSDIWDEFKLKIVNALIGMVLAAVMILIGSFVFLIPGIYVAVVFYILVPIIVFEDVTFGQAITRSFEITKGKWWNTLGAFIVLALLAGIINLIVSYILGLILSVVGHGFFVSGLRTVIIQIISVVITSVTTILPVLLYASYLTEKEDPILFDRINDINEDSSEHNIFETKENTQNIGKEDEDKWEQLLDEDEKKNRFDDDNEEDRFKPKF